MADLVPVPVGGSGGSLLAPFTDPLGGSMPARFGAFLSQGPVRRALPWFGGIAAIGLTGLLWLSMAPAPQRMLYSELSDNERAQVTAALDKAAITYRIDNATGAITVGEDDLYKARMVAAADGALATPETGEQMIDKLPMGASRTLEGQRLQAARERELELTIMQIDGVEAVRVHLAEPEKSAFVRDTVPPTASVMVRLSKGRQLSDSQVSAIVGLVAGSVPGLAVDAVRVIDQHGRLLASDKPGDNDRLEMQGRLEEKLRQQVAGLLTPMLGEGNFSTEIQVELDMDQLTSARESYDKQGVVRSETQSASQSPGGSGAAGVPGVLSNTPPAPTQPQPGAPGAPAAPASGAATPAPPQAVASDSTSTKNYELGREVAVTNAAPGKIRRLSVAVALSSEAMAKAKPAEIEQIKQLVSAAVGANPARGDQVAIAMRSFRQAEIIEPKFWETPWFATLVRNGVALLAVLMTLLLGVRPLIKALKRDGPDRGRAGKRRKARDDDDDEDDEDESGNGDEGGNARTPSVQASPALVAAQDPTTGVIDAEMLAQQVGLAQQLVQERPDSAVAALRQMLNQPEPEGAAP